MSSPSPATATAPPPPSSSISASLSTITTAIQSNTIRNIILLTGAGLSTSTGIPDFRTPEVGLYAKLAPLNLPYPEAIFHISYFRHTPEPFYAIARARHPRNLKPGVGHAFLALLEKKGLLGGVLTQNIDGLEVDAGVSEEKVVNAHGSWKSQRCIKCHRNFGDGEMKAAVERGEVPICQEEDEKGEVCGGIVKPDIVMFGESLHAIYDRFVEEVLPTADLVVVIGTSLKVYPVAGIPRSVPEGTPRVLINNEVVGDFGARKTDVCLIGSVEDGVRRFARELGWEGELEEVWKEAVERKERVLEMEGWSNDGPSLDEAIAEAAEKMKVRMGVSEGHRRMLEGHLGDKLAGIMGRMKVEGK
ncbi:DHS-like NAD/FAD-binding domain-containing protein [Aspergillus karnatakaensis]|uniref:DHS-like NAD/FAD-binding domain-containing protein n=1 Tax=Aspergillus karnatakaensis TaxID=1810916 RepID=UPI003CCD5D3D